MIRMFLFGRLWRFCSVICEMSLPVAQKKPDQNGRAILIIELKKTKSYYFSTQVASQQSSLRYIAEAVRMRHLYHQ